MTANEFDTGMNLIYSRWDKKSYPEQLRMRIWYHCQVLPYKSFEKIILTLMDTSRYAPMPNEFRILAHAERERLGLSDDGEPKCKPSNEAKCWICADSGNLFAIHRENKSTATFRCSCSVGASRPVAQGTQWNNSFGLTYDIEHIYPGVAGNWKPRPGLSLVKMLDALSGEIKKTRKSELKPAKEILNPNGDDAA